jgi:hypothetical protein
MQGTIPSKTSVHRLLDSASDSHARVSHHLIRWFSLCATLQIERSWDWSGIASFLSENIHGFDLISMKAKTTIHTLLHLNISKLNSILEQGYWVALA